MDDNQNKNQPNSTPSDYQKILDEYAASVKPDTTQPPEDSPEEKIPADSLKETISLPPEPKKITAETTEKTLADDLEEVMVQKKQSEPPIHPSLAVNLEENDTIETKPIGLPPETTIPPIKTSEPEITPPEKTPEEIKAEINRLLEDDPKPQDSSGSVSPKTGSNIGKIFFIFALILFFAVAAGLAYFLFLVPSNSNKSNSNNNSVTPTVTPVVDETGNSDTNSDSCTLNDKNYQVGESFKSADGCNTCSCQSVGVIVCTEMACSTTPATKSATVTSTTTKSTIPTGWKTYTSKDFKFSISLPSDWKLVFPADGSLDTNPLTDKSFNDNGAGGLFTTVSSPDKKQEITLMDTFDLGAAKCSTKTSTINNLQVKKITCSGLTDSNAIPGPVNYEFVGKGLYITTTSSTTTIDSVISNIKFN